MAKTLEAQAALRLAATLVVLAAMLFLSASSLRFWQAWAFLLITAGFWTYFFLDLLKNDPQLLARRLQSKESEPVQKLLLKLLSLFLYLGFILAGLDFRLGWSRTKLGGMPLSLIMGGEFVVVAGYCLVFWVTKTNTFAASTIQVEEGQRVIEAGPYALVRHPMYFGMALTAMAAPFALGSYVAIPAFALIVPALMFRLVHEERTLHKNLAEYALYCQRTRFRLLPWIW